MSGLCDQEEVSSSVNRIEESLSTAWTDEKHSLYLDSMEASFVKQLYNHEYNAIDLLGWRSRRKNQPSSSSAQSKAKTHKSGQFKVLQIRSWKKINFGGAQHGLEFTKESHLNQENPRLHLRSVKQLQEATMVNLSKSGAPCRKLSNAGRHSRLPSESPAFPSESCQNFVFSYKEMSGQNFVDEAKEPEHSRRLCKTKRLKTLSEIASRKDQVVPVVISPVNLDPCKTYFSVENKLASTHQESENVGHIVSSESGYQLARKDDQ